MVEETREIQFAGTKNEYGFLSNFYLAPFLYKDRWWASTEHAYQAAKTDVPEQIREIQSATTPGKAKRLGQKVTLREDWESVKDTAMFDVCLAKFLQNPEIAEKLLATGDATLVEHTPWKDYYWGDGGDGTGQNKLGVILMGIRTLLVERIKATYDEKEST